jgi:hypothetical protein
MIANRWKRAGVIAALCASLCWSATRVGTLWEATAMLETDPRLWVNLDPQARFGSGWVESVQQLQDPWSATGERRVGRRTFKERITPMEPVAHNAHTGPITEIPAMIQRDGDRGHDHKPTGNKHA